MKLPRFDEKVALIGGGLGRMKKSELILGLSGSVAKELVNRGIKKVILVDHDYELAKICAEKLGDNVEAIECDLLKERTFTTEPYTDHRGRQKTKVIWTDNPALDMVNKIVEKYGHLDIVISNFDHIENARCDHIDEKMYEKLRLYNITPVFHLMAAVHRLHVHL